MCLQAHNKTLICFGHCAVRIAGAQLIVVNTILDLHANLHIRKEGNVTFQDVQCAGKARFARVRRERYNHALPRRM